MRSFAVSKERGSLFPCVPICWDYIIVSKQPNLANLTRIFQYKVYPLGQPKGTLHSSLESFQLLTEAGSSSHRVCRLSLFL